MNPPFDLAFYIGRFQPWHNGHLTVLNAALAMAKQTLILVGDPPRPAPGFDFDEVCQMIYGSIPMHQLFRVDVLDITDDTSDIVWAGRVLLRVAQYAHRHKLKSTVLVGHRKPDTTYFDLFHGIHKLEVPDFTRISGTKVREIFSQGVIPADMVPESTAEILHRRQLEPK